MKPRETGWLAGLPLKRLRYAITPSLVRSLTWAHHRAQPAEIEHVLVGDLLPRRRQTVEVVPQGGHPHRGGGRVLSTLDAEHGSGLRRVVRDLARRR